MSRQRFVITDSAGRVVRVQVTMPPEFVTFLRGTRGEEFWNYRAVWQALDYGGLGAQSGEIAVLGGAGEPGASHVYHLQLMAVTRGGRARPLVLLKMWLTGNGTLRTGSGTLFQGVNLGLQAGEIAWSETAR